MNTEHSLLPVFDPSSEMSPFSPDKYIRLIELSPTRAARAGFVFQIQSC